MRVIRGALLAALLGVVSGCGATAGGSPPTSGSATGAGLSSTATSTYSSRGADILFAQMTLLHHEQTVTLADLATTKAGIRSEVRELARDVRAIEEPDIAVLRAWLLEWNAPERLNVHSGHPMKGILLDVEMAGMEALDGPAFESAWLVRMIAHQDGAAEFAGSVVRRTGDDRVRTMARRVIQTMPAQVVQLQALR